MPSPELDNRYQRAVLWSFLSYDAYGGPVVDIAVELGVRWKWNYTEMLDPQRNSIMVDAQIIVDQDIAIDSLIWLGKLTDLSGTAGPDIQHPDGLCQVKAFKYTPDLKNRFIKRTVGVIRYKGPLPTGEG